MPSKTRKIYLKTSAVILMNRKPKAILEGILFACGEAVPVKRLSEVMEMTEGEVRKILNELCEEYDNSPERGIHIIRLEDSYQLCTKREGALTPCGSHQRRTGSFVGSGIQSACYKECDRVYPWRKQRRTFKHAHCIGSCLRGRKAGRTGTAAAFRHYGGIFALL